jgi:ABC-type amino acid transport substrate-binding protein
MATLQARGRIRVGTSENNAPFSQRDASGSWSGFDVDLARELARAIFGASGDPDSEIEFVPVTSATRIPSLVTDKVDVVFQTLVITDERKQQIDLSDAYFITGQRLLIKRSDDTITGVADLGPDKTVCVQRGAPAEKAIRDATLGRARILSLDGYPACLEALQQGAADAVSTDEGILYGLVRQDPTTKIVGKPLTAQGYGVGIKKDQGGDRAGFLPFINDWLDRLEATGVWQRLYEKDITPLSGDTRRVPGD